MEGGAEERFGSEAIQEAEQEGLLCCRLDGQWGMNEVLTLTAEGRAYVGLPTEGLLSRIKSYLQS